MAYYKISFVGAMGAGAPVLGTIPSQVEALTADGTTTIEAEGGEFAVIYSDVSAHYDIGGNPSASTTTGFTKGAGGTVEHGPLARGDKVSVAAA